MRIPPSLVVIGLLGAALAPLAFGAGCPGAAGEGEGEGGEGEGGEGEGDGGEGEGEGEGDGGEGEGDCQLPDRVEPDCSAAGQGFGGEPAADFDFVVYSQFDGFVVAAPFALGTSCALPQSLDVVAVGNETDLQALITCDNEADRVASGVDFTSAMVVFFGFAEQNTFDIPFVVDDAGSAAIGVERTLFCGGAAPGSSFAAVVVHDLFSARINDCTHGSPTSCCSCDVVCDPDPRETNCSCPP